MVSHGVGVGMWRVETAIQTPWIAPTVPVRAAAVGARVRSWTTFLTSPPLPPPPRRPHPLPQPHPQEQPSLIFFCVAQRRDTVLNCKLRAKWTAKSQSPSQNQHRSESLCGKGLCVYFFCNVCNLKKKKKCVCVCVLFQIARGMNWRYEQI